MARAWSHDYGKRLSVSFVTTGQTGARKNSPALASLEAKRPPRNPTRAACEEATDSEAVLQIKFRPSNIMANASPGMMLAQVAEDAGVMVNVGCGEGQCGACEVEIKKDGGAGDAFVVRSCITPIPQKELIAEAGELWEVSTDFDFGVW